MNAKCSIGGDPVDVSPDHDDPVLAADPQRNNNFDFSGAADQTKCPFAAHIRKNNPRSDLPRYVQIDLLIYSSDLT